LEKSGLIELATSVLNFMQTTLAHGGHYLVDKKYENRVPILPQKSEEKLTAIQNR
jgi:hypothetical protein